MSDTTFIDKITVIEAPWLNDVNDTVYGLPSNTGTALVTGTWFGGVIATLSSLATNVGASLIGFTQGVTGAISMAVQSVLRETVSVKRFGAVGDGVTDDSVAFASAIAYVNTLAASAVSSGLNVGTAKLLVPPGDYIVNTGIAAAAFRCQIVGAGRDVTRIRIAAGQYFLTVSGGISSGRISGISFSGGSGILKHTYTGTNVQGILDMVDNNYQDYTECAICSLSTDFPYIKIKNSLFYGTTTSKGVALAGYPDLGEIDGNSFLLNRYHLKLGRGGNNIKITKNDFIRFANGGGSPILTDIWIVPNPLQLNSGAGMLIFGNKFGNENLNVVDMRILIADEAAGTNFIDKNHTTTPSTGYSIGVEVTSNYVAGIDNYTKGFVYSYTPNVRSWKVDNFWTVKYPYIIQYDAGVTVSDDRTSDTSLVVVGGNDDPFETLTPPVSSSPGTMTVRDPFGLTSGQSSFVQERGAGFDPGFTDLWTTSTSAINKFTLVSATRVAGTDSTGDADAAEITYSNSSGIAYGYLSATTANRNTFVEIDVKQAASQSLSNVEISLRTDGGVVVFKRIVAVPAAWQRVRFPWVPRLASSVISLHVRPVNYSAGVRDKITIGRARVYHAAEPTDIGGRYLQALKTFDWPSVANGASTTTTLTVTGAAFGDFVVASMDLSLAGLSMTAYVSSVNTVTIVLSNSTGGAIDLASGVLRVKVIKSVSYVP